MPEAQAVARWSPPRGTLGELVQEAARRAAALDPERAAWERAAAAAPAPPSLRAALQLPTVAVIAEVKRRSPSRGEINAALAAGSQARAYASGGAAAVSVLTESTRFGGSADDLREVVASVALPAIRKDFHVAPVQLYEARALGAAGVLLIARALPPRDLAALVALAREIGVEPMVEIRDEAELGRALDSGAALIGVNNRDLETLRVDPGTVERLLPRIPSGVVAVAESGMHRVDDVERAAAAGADAVLVGSALSAAAEPARAVAALASVQVRRSGRAA